MLFPSLDTPKHSYCTYNSHSEYITLLEVLGPAFQLPAVQQLTFQYVYLYIQFQNPFSSQWLPRYINFVRINVWDILLNGRKQQNRQYLD